VNQVFYLTSSTSRGNSFKRKNPSTKIVNESCFVAGTGLTPSFHAVIGPFGELNKEALIAPQLFVFFLLQVDASNTYNKKKSLQISLKASL